MLNLVPAQNVAETAHNLYQSGNIVYLRAGSTPPGMDSGGFIHYCLKKNGIYVSSRGTNTLYREIGAGAITIEEAMKQGKIVPGAILFHVTHDGGEQIQFIKDGRGNADFASICIAPRTAVYPSEKEGKLIKTEIELVSGKANMVVFHKDLDYGFMPTNQTPQNPTPESSNRMVVVNGGLNLRQGPTPQMRSIKLMPKGSLVTVLARQNDWAQVQFTNEKGRIITGWAMTKYLRDA